MLRYIVRMIVARFEKIFSSPFKPSFLSNSKAKKEQELNEI